jgi:glycosyltransferase involved in cell wall biosynthesis
MVHYTALVPLRDGADALARLLPDLARVLERLILPYEIIAIDDGSREAESVALARVLAAHRHVRLLRFDEPRGTSAALAAGIAAARGELVIAMGSQPPLGPEFIPHLISRLGRWDLAVAEPERTLGQRIRHAVAGARSILRKNRPQDPAAQPLFAARREALVGLPLAPQGSGYLGNLAARGGWRVCRVAIAPGLPPVGRALRPGWFKRLAAAWLARRFEPHLARELAPLAGDPTVTLPPADAPRQRHAPRPAAGSLETKYAK